MPMPAPTPAAKWLVDALEPRGEVEGKVEGKLVGKIVGKGEVEDSKDIELVLVASVNIVGEGGFEDSKELELVVVNSFDVEKLEVVTETLEGELGRLVEEVIAAREKTRDEVWQQSARERS